MPDNLVREPTVSLTFSQIKEIIAEIKKPSPEEQEKLAFEAKKKEALRAEKIALATLDAQMKEQRETNCAHVKPNGETTVKGQYHTDGYYHPICFRCGKEFPPVKGRIEDMVLG